MHLSWQALSLSLLLCPSLSLSEKDASATNMCGDIPVVPEFVRHTSFSSARHLCGFKD